MKPWLFCIAVALSLAGPPTAIRAQESATEDRESEPATDARGVRRLGDVIGTGSSDFAMDIPELQTPQPIAEQPEVSLPDAARNERLQEILSRRAFAPDDPRIESELSALLDEVEAVAGDALDAGDLGPAERLSEVIEAFDAQREIVTRVADERERRAEIERLLAEAAQALEAGNLLEPAEASALALYRRVLEIDEGNAAAIQGVQAAGSAMLANVDALVSEGDLEDAELLLRDAEQLEIDPEAIDARRQLISSAVAERQRSLLDEIRQAIEAQELERAEAGLDDLIGLGAPAPVLDDLRTALEDARRYGGLEPGQVFEDPLSGLEASGPSMVVIPTGSFMMGSPEGEEGRADNEGPRFRVRFERGFAMSRAEITVGQFRRFVEASGYETDAERAGESRIYMTGSGRIAERRRITWEDDFLGNRADEDLPVLHVSWNDAAAYAAWLAERTQRSYRLPTEAEFEYALRAGSQTLYWWGDQAPQEPVENVTGEDDEFDDRRRWTEAFPDYGDGYWGPAPAASLEANPFGLFDMGGNVMEWVADCWHDSYVRAPNDGSAWVNPGCERRVIRGASWSSTPPMSRSAYRLSSRVAATDARVGFRVARDL
jgi:formylglycine-generating enzyme required for sulfatase activity